MPQQSWTKLDYADPTDPASLEGVTQSVAESYRGPIPVATSTEQAQVAAAATAAGRGASTASPLFVFRLDTRKIMIDTGGGFVQYSAPTWGYRGSMDIPLDSKKGDVTVNFPVGMFVSPPAVTVTWALTRIYGWSLDVTASSVRAGFTVGDNDTITTSGVRDFSLIAVGI